MSNLTTNTPVPAALSPSDQSENDIDLLWILSLLWRGRWIIGFVTILTAALAFFYVTERATPLYQATATLAFESSTNEVTNFESVVSGLDGDQAEINTEVEVLRSREMIGDLVRTLDLTSDPEFSRNAAREQAALQDPPTGVAAVLQTVQTTVRDFLTGGEFSRDYGEAENFDLAVDRVTNALAISNIRQTYVFNIRAETTDPEKSARIANTLADLYIQDRFNQKLFGTENAVEYLSSQSVELQAELQQTELDLREFSTTTELISPEALLANNRQLKNLRDLLSEAQDNRREAEAKLALLQTYNEDTDVDNFVATVGDSGLAAANRRLSDGRIEREAFTALVQAQIASTENDIARLTVQAEQLDVTVGEFEADVAQQSADLLRIQQLEREVQASGAIYEHFLTRLKETSVQVGLQSADARILSVATAPRSAAKPQKRLIVLIGALLGGLLGVAIVVLRELRQNTFRLADELEAVTGRTVIGQVPANSVRKRAALIEFLRTKSTSAYMEAVRNLRTSILLSGGDTEPQVIMITSSVPSEGKTTISLSLAKNFADMGKRTLLIEADIRRRTFDAYFETKDTIKLVDAVVSDAPVKESASTIEPLGCQILFGGQSGVNAADFFSSERFAGFMKRAREDFDVILIDTPPVLVVSDARIIAAHADATLYVVHWDRTPKRLVRQGVKSLADIGQPVSGMILSQIDPAGMKRYGYGQSYGGYGSYGDKYYDA